MQPHTGAPRPSTPALIERGRAHSRPGWSPPRSGHSWSWPQPPETRIFPTIQCFTSIVAAFFMIDTRSLITASVCFLGWQFKFEGKHSWGIHEIKPVWKVCRHLGQCTQILAVREDSIKLQLIGDCFQYSRTVVLLWRGCTCKEPPRCGWGSLLPPSRSTQWRPSCKLQMPW